jgi:carbon-monoxide dehydrogenase large subunit
MYAEALRLLDYDRWRARQQAQAGSSRLVGIGLAGYVEGTGIGPFESGSVSVDTAGNVRVATGTCSQGQGHATTFAQIVAEVLKVPVERIEVVGGDTATIPYGFGTVASRGIVTGGSAVATAAGEVRDKALRVSAALLETSLEDLELCDGAVTVRGAPERAVSLGSVARALLPGVRRPGGEQPGLAAESYFEPPTVTYSSGVHAVALEVDRETGEVELLRYVVVHDCGRVVNPVIVDAQVVGGVAQGIGGALYEELDYDDEGQLLTTSLMDYLLPTANEVPDIDLGHKVYLSPRNPLGLKGLGEGGAIGPPAAIANAVEDALRPLGVQVGSMPLTPERILALVRSARQS